MKLARRASGNYEMKTKNAFDSSQLLIISKYTVSKANLDLGKNMLLLENPQFLPNHNETLPK